MVFFIFQKASCVVADGRKRERPWRRQPLLPAFRGAWPPLGNKSHQVNVAVLSPESSWRLAVLTLFWKKSGQGSVGARSPDGTVSCGQVGEVVTQVRSLEQPWKNYPEEGTWDFGVFTAKG